MKRLILGCLLFSTSSFASALSLDAQRDVFAETLALQEKEEWQKANQNIQKIADYPIAYLADYYYLKANMDTVSDQAVLDFIAKNKGKIAADDLQRSYLFHLSKEKDWAQFMTTYPRMPNNRQLKCHYLEAAIATGNSEKAWPDAQKYWLSSTSLPNACDDVYVFYQDANQLTQDDVWKRFELGFVNNKRGLMRFLMARMDKDKLALAKNLYDLHEKPETLLNSDLFPSRSAPSFSFLIPTIKRLANQDLGKAMEYYNFYAKKIAFTTSEEKQVKTQFARIIVQRDKSQYFNWLDNELGKLGNVSLIEQRIRYAIKRDDWKNIEFWISQLPDDKRNSSAWLYWQARVLANKGKSEQANALFEKVAKNRNFHGFMAAQKLGVDFSLNAQAIVEKKGSLTGLESELSVIEELLYHELNVPAKRQWQRLLSNQSKTKQQQLGLYAYNKNWPYLSVLASINSKSWNALNIRFPNAKSELFVEAAKQYDVEPTYIYAITRRESSFDQHAKSPVGASGYMQLMPKTAEETAKKIGLTEYSNVEQLNEGELNVQLGTAYFNGLLTRYDGNRVLATAAYNAGPHRVERWTSEEKKKGNKGIDIDSWVDTIPFYETRAYVQNVLAYNVIYQHVFGKPLKFLKSEELSSGY
ncbi:transglycosylase SLT domain-containing protein [Psychromonas sp. 14N.309.X.WAT.B.A12]|uniref:transglycosylase SLT domain-containing protein n=1 Tax=unclassified Psychromonas TaxID=2614957 RepID=UPI0025AFE409|nr:transglycosylase SLT domain-containing protein [Psychromonas sp. 14N.309.X.WAT.B.A12]MDN2662809.1 transglycosylase SLT domain-containing protein [Psychromonas sp. 14N.309.X.WAT.B.A12]